MAAQRVVLDLLLGAVPAGSRGATT